MTSVTVQSRVSPKLKMQAEALFAAIGISTADAIRIFLQQAVNEGGLPFRPTLVKQPNTQTLATIEESDEGGGKRYSNAQEPGDDLGR